MKHILVTGLLLTSLAAGILYFQKQRKNMAVERVVGVHVTNEAQYQQYREHMMPILREYGGQFTWDVKVSEVLKTPVEGEFNRLFTLRFPNIQALENFFANEDYKKIKKTFFTPSVSSTSYLAKYDLSHE